jgi:hypothetical protein
MTEAAVEMHENQRQHSALISPLNTPPQNLLPVQITCAQLLSVTLIIKQPESGLPARKRVSASDGKQELLENHNVF